MKKKSHRLHRLPSVDVIVTTALLLGEQHQLCSLCDGTRKVAHIRCSHCGGIGLAAIGHKTIEAAGIPIEALPNWRRRMFKHNREVERAKKAASREL